jgi:hypothetical protein
MVGGELDGALHAKYPNEPVVIEFHNMLTSATRAKRSMTSGARSGCAGPQFRKAAW